MEREKKWAKSHPLPMQIFLNQFVLVQTCMAKICQNPLLRLVTPQQLFGLFSSVSWLWNQNMMVPYLYNLLLFCAMQCLGKIDTKKCYALKGVLFLIKSTSSNSSYLQLLPNGYNQLLKETEYVTFLSTLLCLCLYACVYCLCIRNL